MLVSLIDCHHSCYRRYADLFIFRQDLLRLRVRCSTSLDPNLTRHTIAMNVLLQEIRLLIACIQPRRGCRGHDWCGHVRIGTTLRLLYH